MFFGKFKVGKIENWYVMRHVVQLKISGYIYVQLGGV